MLFLCLTSCVDLTPPWRRGDDAARLSDETSDTGGAGGIGGSGAGGVGEIVAVDAGGSGGTPGLLTLGTPDGAASTDTDDAADDDATSDTTIAAGDSGASKGGAAGNPGGAGEGSSAAGGPGTTAASDGGGVGRGGGGGTMASSGGGGVVGQADSGTTTGLDAGVCSGQDAVDTGTNVDAGLSDGMVVRYTCDQWSGTTLPDSSGNGRDATLGGSGCATGTGKIGGALTLNGSGSSYAALPAGLLSGACEATIATWVYVNVAPDASPRYWARIWDFGKDTNAYMCLVPTSNGTGNPHFAITVAGGGAEQVIDGNTPLPTGRWTHVAVVLGSGGGILYVDGAKVGANAAMTLRPADLGVTTNNYIGRSQYAWDPYLDGAVDEFRVYQRALSSDEIKALFAFAGP